MDVSRAKVIIIILLAAFNIFLLSNNLAQVRGQNTGETVSNTVMILKQRGVTLECSMPKEIGTFRKLRYGNGVLDRTSMAKKLLGDAYVMPGKGDVYESNGKKIEFSGDMKFSFSDVRPSLGFDLQNDDKLKKTLQDRLKELGLIDKNYVVDQFERNQDGSITIYFIEKYEGFLLFDNYCKVLLTSEGISKLDYSKYQVIGFSGDKTVQPQAYQALLAYYKDSYNKTITSIDCGYSLEASSLDGMETVEVLPEWHAKIKGESKPDILKVEIADDKTVQ